MSTSTMKRLSSEVMALSQKDRAKLALELIKSLDGPADEDVEEAWDQEVMRRMDQIDSGHAKLLSREEFRKRLQAKIRNK